MRQHERRTWRPLPTALLIALMLGAPMASAAETVEDEEQELVRSFLAFAETEWERIVASIDTGPEHSIERMEATKLPMSSKQVYVVVWIDQLPTTYEADVRRTDSIQHPFKGQIAFVVPVERGTLIVKGPKKHCREKPLKECLEGGGKIVEGGFLTPSGGQLTAEVPTEVVLHYVPGGEDWEREGHQTVIEIVNTVPTASTVP